MKKTYLLPEFLAVLVFLILPPLFSSPSGGKLDAQKFFYFPVFIELLIAVALEFQSAYIKKTEEPVKKTELFRLLFWIPLTTGLLFLALAANQTVRYVWGIAELKGELFTDDSVSGVNIGFLIFNFFCAAFYEEAVYRHFFSESLLTLLPGNRVVRWSCETAAVLIFALSHRSGGIFSIVNAAVCGTVLRLCFVRTKSVTAGTAAHFIYNIVLLAFALLI